MCSSTIKSYLPDSLAVSFAAASGSERASGALSVFSESISRDLEGIQGVQAGLDWTGVREFMDMVEQCEGQIFLSGIGRQILRLLSRPNVVELYFPLVYYWYTHNLCR